MAQRRKRGARAAVARLSEQQRRANAAALRFLAVNYYRLIGMAREAGELRPDQAAWLATPPKRQDEETE